MDLQVLRSIWPVFSAETREQIQTIGAKVLGLEQDPAGRDPDLMVTLKRLVHSLKGSAGSLGLEDIESVAHAIEDGIERFAPDAQLSREVVETTLQGLSAIEMAVARGDMGESPIIPGLAQLLSTLGTSSHGAEGQAEPEDGFAARGLSTLGALEAALGELCSPRVEDRALKVGSAVELAQALQAAAEANGDFTVVRLAEDAARGFG
ncbi:MAG TPA: Hpt domain-containing protein, partial [Aggregicoccus sp.]|nr:Hpt domain-containing protein [Aggregicoccus sp.]